MPPPQNTMPEHLSTPVSVRQVQSEEKKKKKRKKKSKTADLPEAGSEIADDYKEKYEEDLVEDPYDRSHPLAQRVEYAIWKYRKNHRFSDEKKAIFENYLAFGGITTGPNAFLGRATSADTKEDGIEEDFEAAKVPTDHVPDFEEDQDTDVVVSFSEVAQVYLGNTFVRESRFIALQDFVDAPVLIDAFLRYLQIRNVCPEYAEDIAKARDICALAKEELPRCKRGSILLPGKFNKACSILFEGELKAVSFVSAGWEGATNKVQDLIDSFLADTVGMTRVEAQRIVETIVPSVTHAHVVETRFQIIVQITEVEDAPEGGEDGFVDVVLQNYEDKDTFKVKLEKNILKELGLGMVMTATLYKLNCDQWYLDRATLVMPSFYMKDGYADKESYE
ncbi:Argonaute siRNA chaperone complex subunit Arb1-domain-containing protein [Spinellus fusiger]|nr:Argonaute siRNA chaperone complex subunit Arb1-domain-containing protein [Spinellus fusiger]